ncbi:MAG: hypothetical protein FWD48_01035 [Oscillospiraceae bacterium]|nr:hypothetical protein [Oscillospiraceae bacterium]
MKFEDSFVLSTCCDLDESRYSIWLNPKHKKMILKSKKWQKFIIKDFIKDFNRLIRE